MLESQLPARAADGVSHDGAAIPGRWHHEAGSRPETAVGRGTGVLRLRDGKAWTLLTALGELKGHEEPKGDNRPPGAIHGAHPDRLSWLEMREREARELGHEVQPEVVIVGGGQGGIALGARLRQLGVPTIIVERNERPGDSWRKRYKSLCLHDPVWDDHTPYRKLPRTGRCSHRRTRSATGSRCTRGSWSSTTGVRRRRSPRRMTPRQGVAPRRRARRRRATLRPKQLAMATGMAGKPEVPEIPGMDVFKGDQHHSCQHPGPDAYEGKRCVVIGSNNSAHDICAALWEAGAAEVTMVQRSSTHRPLRVAHGPRHAGAVLRGGGRQRRDHRARGHHLRVDALPDHARGADPPVRADPRAGPRAVRPPRARRLPARLRRRRVRRS